MRFSLYSNKIVNIIFDSGMLFLVEFSTVFRILHIWFRYLFKRKVY